MARTRNGQDQKRGYRILAVEDDADVLESFKTLLELIGNEVRTALDGPSALAIAREFHPDIAFLDIALPGMDGYELAQRMRQEYGPALRLYALTGLGQANGRERALRAGFDQYLIKPIDLETLQRLLGPIEGSP